MLFPMGSLCGFCGVLHPFLLLGISCYPQGRQRAPYGFWGNHIFWDARLGFPLCRGWMLLWEIRVPLPLRFGRGELHRFGLFLNQNILHKGRQKKRLLHHGHLRLGASAYHHRTLPYLVRRYSLSFWDAFPRCEYLFLISSLAVPKSSSAS